MTLSIESDAYRQDGIEIIEYTIAADEEGGQEFIGFVNDDNETDAFTIATVISGDAKFTGDGFQPDDALSNGPHRGFAYDADQNFGAIGISVQLTAGAVVSLLVGRIRRGIAATRRKLSCKLCKAAVRAIIHTALAFAGIPLPTTGTDLSAVQTAFEAALDALKQGNVGAALQSLMALMPPSVWDAIKQTLHFVAWIWDTMDKVLERACVFMNLCPKPPPTPSTP